MPSFVPSLGSLRRAAARVGSTRITMARVAAPVLVVAALLAFQAPAAAQEAEPLTYEEARIAMDAAEAESRANGWNLAIVVTDAEGVPLYLRRFGGAGPRFHEIAMGKVYTMLQTGMTSGEYGRAVQAGEMEPIEGGVTFEGGYLIRRGGEVIGAMSASGARGSEDAQVVRAGLAAIGLEP
ncbi:MAG: heme-binding protein [Gemmatimonadales bacterium]|nr:MAG: heme-binding protein [Gemmatimonadales bacterium]